MLSLAGGEGEDRVLQDAAHRGRRGIELEQRVAGQLAGVLPGRVAEGLTGVVDAEVAELKDNINAMVQSLRETIQANQQQDWLKSNLARISGMMQGHRDLAVVAELIMDELAPLVGAQHGTFFLAEPANGDTRLRLIAGCA
jgi:hypothetical protein